MARITYNRYAMKSKGTLPRDGFVRFDSIVPNGYHAVAIYNRMLTDKEVKKYNLTDLNKPVNALTKQRLLAGMRQNDLAKMSGISLRTIQGWELNGTTGAALGKISRVAKVLHCSIEDLLDEEDAKWMPDTSKEFEA